MMINGCGVSDDGGGKEEERSGSLEDNGNISTISTSTATPPSSIRESLIAMMKLPRFHVYDAFPPRSR